MAGVADRAFREVCAEFGAAYLVGEMASARGIAMGNRKSMELLSVERVGPPMAVQLFGDDPDSMARAARAALAQRPDIIDINMGCPAPKVAAGGGGAALMRRPELAARIVRAVSDAVAIPVTVKMRKGWDEESVNAVEFARLMERSGAAALTVHGRTRAQMYAPPVDLDVIAEVKAAVSIPVIGNGDIFSAEEAQSMYDRTGCDLVMVGRGALGAPWLFAEIEAWLRYRRRRAPPPGGAPQGAPAGAGAAAGGRTHGGDAAASGAFMPVPRHGNGAAGIAQARRLVYAGLAGRGQTAADGRADRGAGGH
jgi:nifR3 family TIM-barrel protein